MPPAVTQSAVTRPTVTQPAAVADAAMRAGVLAPTRSPAPEPEPPSVLGPDSLLLALTHDGAATRQWLRGPGRHRADRNPPMV